MLKLRVAKRRRTSTPDHWCVQKLDGYTNGKPSWRLFTLERFWSKAAAEEFIAARQKAFADAGVETP